METFRATPGQEQELKSPFRLQCFEYNQKTKSNDWRFVLADDVPSTKSVLTVFAVDWQNARLCQGKCLTRELERALILAIGLEFDVDGQKHVEKLDLQAIREVAAR